MRRRIPPGELSPAERSTLHLLANGRQASELAAELHLAPNTIRVHRRRAFRKLGVDNLIDAVAEALRRDILRPDEVITGPLTFLAHLHATRAKLAAVRRWAGSTQHAQAAAEILTILNPRGNTHVR